MKKILLLFFSILFIGLVSSVSSCSQPGYQYCSQESYGSAYAKVYLDFPLDRSENGISTGGYAVDELYAKVGMQGDKIYFYENIGSWNSISCGSSGCNGREIYANEFRLASVGEQYTSCPAFVAWDYD